MKDFPVSVVSPILKRRFLTILSLPLIVCLSACVAEEKPEPAEESPEPVAEVKPVSREVLKGRWIRHDGGYVLQVDDVLSSGRAKVSYFNPRRINVAGAEVSGEAGNYRIIIELRDQGYPGSYYDLTYNPDADGLEGTYFQAVQRQVYQVYFVRE